MEKLVRDRIKEFSKAAKDGRRFRKALKREMPLLFAHKIIEEAHEIAEELFKTKPDLCAVAEEVADMTEVLRALLEHFYIEPKTVVTVRQVKALRKGAFKTRLVLDLSSNPQKFRK